MEVALRLPPGFPLEPFREAATAAAGPARLSLRGYEPAYRAEKNTPLVRAFLAAIRAEGGQPRFTVKTGTSDMNVVGPAWNCPIIAYGPGDSDLDHTPNEHIDVRELQRGVSVLTRALDALMKELIG
jgi:LysW-gamma-L-lysine carboxypeptidase